MEISVRSFDWLVELGIVNPDEFSVPPNATFVRLDLVTTANFENGLNFGFIFEVLAEDGLPGYSIQPPQEALETGSSSPSDAGLGSTIITPPVISLYVQPQHNTTTQHYTTQPHYTTTHR